MSRCEGLYRDHITRELCPCDAETEPGETYCRDCMGEPEDDPDWAWDARHEW